MPTPILMPRLGQSVESCILAKWLVKVGDTVAAGQPLASYETDKASFEIESPAAGTVLALFFEEGADVPVLTNVGAIGAAGEDVSALRLGGAAAATEDGGQKTEDSGQTTAEAAPSSVIRHPSSEASGASPRAKNLAAKHGLDATALPGTGPGGRVIERDVQAALNEAPRLSAAAKAAGRSAGPGGTGPAGMVLASDKVSGFSVPAFAEASAGRQGSAKEPAAATIPLKGIRKLIADRMKASLASTAQLTMTMSFDLTAVQEARAKAKEAGRKVTINDLICLATVQTLQKHPDLNAHFLGDQIVQHSAVNLGIAVDTPRGLMVPVVHGADRLNLAGLSSAIKALADAAQKGAVNPDQLKGGTFTITNLGALGVETFTPVLNVPEVAILGVGGIQWKHLKRAGRIQLVESITLSLTVDHQVVDGAPAARFLKDLCEALENVE
jgi:pyruvate dehydrogenase E2 component (dihydrolipoamide acetyltransferase)